MFHIHLAVAFDLTFESQISFTFDLKFKETRYKTCFTSRKFNLELKLRNAEKKSLVWKLETWEFNKRGGGRVRVGNKTVKGGKNLEN